MPFTLAHPAAVLPLRRLGMPMTALVIGSMVPDLPMFARSLGGYGVIHSWHGVFTVDPMIAVGLCALWYVVLRDALVDLAPGPLRGRLAPHAGLSRRQWLLVPVAAAAGAATHVVWDAFTHPGRWGVALVPLLGEVHGGLPGHQWAQYLSGAVGLVVLAAALAGFLRRQAVVRRPMRATGVRGRLASGSGAAVVLGSALTALAAATTARWNPHLMVFDAVVHGLTVLGVGLVMVCLLWRAMTARSPA